MNIIEEVREAWGWIGLEPAEIVGENDFGNLIIKDRDGKYWRLCPEGLSCEVIAGNRKELDVLCHDQEFLRDWHMKKLVEDARAVSGPLIGGRKYCLKIPGVLGGQYGGSNLGTVSLQELIRISGDMARQIRDLPDGAKVRFKITE